MATKLDMAEQQLYGFHCAKQGETLSMLVDSMGLARKEWEKLKDNNYVDYLSANEVTEIDEYFKQKE